MLGFLYAFASLFSFSLGKILWKKPLDEFGEYTVLVWSYAFRILMLFPIALYFGLKFFSPSLYAWYALTVAIGAVGIIAFMKSIKTGMTANSAVASAYMLLSVPLAAVLYAESLSQLQVAGAFLVLFGVSGLALLRNKTGLNKWAFVAFAGWGAYFVFIKPIIQEAGVVNSTFFLELGVGTIVIAYALLSKQRISTETRALVLSFWANLFSTIGSFAYYASVALLGAGIAAAVGGGGPVVVAILSFFMLREKLDKINYAAIVLVTVGLIVIAVG